jgi:hypothetical protein
MGGCVSIVDRAPDLIHKEIAVHPFHVFHYSWLSTLVITGKSTIVKGRLFTKRGLLSGILGPNRVFGSAFNLKVACSLERHRTPVYRWEGRKVVGLSLKSRRRKTREKDCVYHILNTIAFDQSSTQKNNRCCWFQTVYPFFPFWSLTTWTYVFCQKW